ncbi:hypothetical protein [Paenibacillus xanthanilyticus]|uniref:DUF3139 domain-containing protein n=1 Tax=Paenibacillus xanthanilyticus TaxID=1783531 RepID=A0ABV8K086_9BACL
MTRKAATILLASLLIIVTIAFLAKKDAEDFVREEFPPTGSDWGNMKIVKVEKWGGYTSVDVIYQTKKDFTPPDRWFIKDRKKVRDIEGDVLTEWEGTIYLIRNYMISWKAIL